jgi:hypothetical protein
VVAVRLYLLKKGAVAMLAVKERLREQRRDTAEKIK